MSVLKKLYSDYFMKTRIGEYEDLIVYMLKHDYQIVSCHNFYNMLNNNLINSNSKIFINRHDIDTDTKTARKMFEIEKRYAVFSTYYFRLSTLDFCLMKEIHNYGSEVGYHFEELATFAKKNNLYTKNKILSKIHDIRSNFEENFLSLENKLGFKIKSVASHGDFTNRKLGITNHPVTDSENLRGILGIQFEAYDKQLTSNFSIYISDRLPPQKYYPLSPYDAIKNNNVICLLTHPRQWHSSWVSNSKENIVRLVEGLRWGE